VLVVKGITTRGQLRRAVKSVAAPATAAATGTTSRGETTVELGETGIFVKKWQLDQIVEVKRQQTILRIRLAHPNQQRYAKLSLTAFVEAVVKENSSNTCFFNSDVNTGGLIGFRGENEAHVDLFVDALLRHR
jgi:hypothetical protein